MITRLASLHSGIPELDFQSAPASTTPRLPARPFQLLECNVGLIESNHDCDSREDNADELDHLCLGFENLAGRTR